GPVFLVRVGVVDEHRFVARHRVPDQTVAHRDAKLVHPVGHLRPQLVPLVIRQPDGAAVGDDHFPAHVGHQHQDAVEISLAADLCGIIENDSEKFRGRRFPAAAAGMPDLVFVCHGGLHLPERRRVATRRTGRAMILFVFPSGGRFSCRIGHFLKKGVVPLAAIVIGLAGSAVVALYAWRRGSLSRSGAVAAIAVGTILFGAGSPAWFGTLLVFFFTSSAWSRGKAQLRQTAESGYEKGSRRDAGQVLANGGLGAALCLAWACWPEGAPWPKDIWRYMHAA